MACQVECKWREQMKLELGSEWARAIDRATRDPGGHRRKKVAQRARYTPLHCNIGQSPTSFKRMLFQTFSNYST